LSVPDEGLSLSLLTKRFSVSLPDEGLSLSLLDEGLSLSLPDEGLSFYVPGEDKAYLMKVTTYLMKVNRTW
jgi:hypothetical protein